MSYYEVCKSNNIIEKIRPLLESGGYKLRNGDGKLFAELGPAWDTPWHHVKHEFGIDCHTWNLILFDHVLDKRFVPSGCQQCYKVVVRPKTLRQLFALLALMMRMQRPSKAGIELRKYVSGLYGGYFYNRGLEAGLECWREVKTAVTDDLELGPDVPVILKRGCTEFEQACGPSDKWEVAEEQLHLEDLVDRYVVRNSYHQLQPEHCLVHVHQSWIEWACANGDETYLEFTDGRPLYQPYVTYHPEEGE